MKTSLSSLAFKALAILLLSGKCACSTQGVEILVPAYANPCCGGGPGMWSKLTATASSSTVAINIILNPASGPGAGNEIDANYINGIAPDPVLDFTAAGGICYGYVATGYGANSIAEVKNDIDKYYNPAYWRGQGIQVSGIFFDEMSSASGDIPYYQELYDYVKSVDSSARVVSNPGISSIPKEYMSTADTLITFEQTGDKYRNSYEAPSWVNDVGITAENFGHLIHTEASTSHMETDVSLAVDRNAGFLYITDDAMSNPWDSLASYWDDLVTALEATYIPIPQCTQDSDCENTIATNSCGTINCNTETGVCFFNAWKEECSSFLECYGDDSLCTRGPIGSVGTCTGWGNNECIYEYYHECPSKCTSNSDCENSVATDSCGTVTCDTETGVCSFNAWKEECSSFLECYGDDLLCTTGPIGSVGTCTGWGDNECIYEYCPLN